jgi:hypothetical protein
MPASKTGGRYEFKNKFNRDFKDAQLKLAATDSMATSPAKKTGETPAVENQWLS